MYFEGGVSKMGGDKISKSGKKKKKRGPRYFGKIGGGTCQGWHSDLSDK